MFEPFAFLSHIEPLILISHQSLYSGCLTHLLFLQIALNMVNKNLSIELKNDGILAVVLHPGWVQTDMGGGRAITSTTECVEGLLSVAEGLGEKDNGLFYDFKGKLIPW